MPFVTYWRGEYQNMQKLFQNIQNVRWRVLRAWRFGIFCLTLQAHEEGRVYYERLQGRD